ncbi:MAG TPA: MFS transporter [Candidatus Saccharimonadales bacterium]|nr:MFS transporter [Candidatus Saccharimonadales bacterium]
MSRLFQPLKFLSALPPPLRVSAFMFFAASLADGVLVPFFAIWAVREAGVPVAAVGLLLGCYAGGELLATPFVGGLSDRLGRRPVLLVSTLGVGSGFAVLYFVHGAIAVAVTLAAIGIFESVLHPTAAAIVADVVAPAELRHHYGINRMASSIGHVVGPALGAILAAWSLGSVFLAGAAALLTAALAVALGLRETRAAVAEEDDDEDLTALGAVFRDRRLAAILLPVALIEIVTSWIEAVMPLAATQVGALTPTGVGWLFAYSGLLGAIFQMPVLRLCRDMLGSRMVAIACTVLALSFGTLAVAPSLAGFVIAATGLAFAGIILDPLVQALVMELAPPQARATYTAALSVVSDLKDAAGPAIGTALFAVAFSLPWFSGMAVTVAAASALAVNLRRHERY